MNPQLKTLRIIHFGFCAGLILLYVLVGDLSLEKLDWSDADITSAVLALVPIAAVLAANLLFRSQMKKTDPKAAAESNMAVYQVASLIRWGVLEGAAFLLLIVSPDMLLPGVLLIAYLILLMPTESRVLRDLERTTL